MTDHCPCLSCGPCPGESTRPQATIREKHNGPGHCLKIKKGGPGVQGCDLAGAGAMGQLWASPGPFALGALTVLAWPGTPPLLLPSYEGVGLQGQRAVSAAVGLGWETAGQGLAGPRDLPAHRGEGRGGLPGTLLLPLSRSLAGAVGGQRQRHGKQNRF